MKNNWILHYALLSKLITAIFFLILAFSSLTQDTYEYENETGFYLEFEETQNSDFAQILALISEDQELIFDVVDDLNSYLDIPVAIPIVFKDCGEVNAFYNPQDIEITICHEMIAQSYTIYSMMDMTGEDLSLAIANNTFSIMYHEIGHALVDILEIPITGREEDAVDQFSVVSLLQFEELGHNALIDFARFWGGLAQLTETSLADIAFYGEHSLSSQRFYDILCLAYGSDPENLSFLIEDGILPPERGKRCPVEFEKIYSAWEILLEPYIRE